MCKWSLLFIISDLKLCVYLGRIKSLFVFQLFGECHYWWTRKTPRTHIAKFYDRFVESESINIFVFKFDCNRKFVGSLHHPFSCQLYLVFFLLKKFQSIISQFYYLFWLRNTDEGAVPEICICSILFMISI